MGTRLELQQILVDVLGSTNVYFQPPESIKLKYPCIVYELHPPTVNYANGKKYLSTNLYQLTLIYKDPESELPSKVRELELCSHDRNFVSDGMYHSVFSLYY